MKNIKYSVNDKVYWLSQKGFMSGIVKSIEYAANYSSSKLRYFLWNKGHTNEYRGDEVEEHLIFTSRQEMIDYYSNLES